MKGQGILCTDTTFEICEGFYLTGTSYPNKSLLDISSGKHPQFPGPFFWHFKKNEEVYRRFAREILIADPSLAGIKKIGHDLDRAIAKGTVYQFPIHIFFENVYQTLTSLFFPLDFESKKKKQKHWRTTTCFLSK